MEEGSGLGRQMGRQAHREIERLGRAWQLQSQKESKLGRRDRKDG